MLSAFPPHPIIELGGLQMRPTTIFIVGMMLVGLLGLVAPSHLAYATDYTFTTLDVPGASFTYAFGINDAGQIVGDYYDGSRYHGFLLSEGQYTIIKVLSAVGTFAHGINNAGQIVGSYFDGSRFYCFLLSDGVFTTLDAPGAASPLGTSAYGINDAGLIVGTYVVKHEDDFRSYGFLFSDGTYTTIDVPGTTMRTEAFGINNDGVLAGYFVDEQGVHGFLAAPK